MTLSLFCAEMLSSDWFVSSFFSVQIDLEPEGKVYVIIDLSGSSSEGETLESTAN